MHQTWESEQCCLAYLSKALGPRTSALSTYEKEALAIIMAVDHWRPYLQSAEFVIHTDQRSLIHLEDQRISTPWQQKVMMKLVGLRYRIVYKREKITEQLMLSRVARCQHKVNLRPCR